MAKAVKAIVRMEGTLYMMRSDDFRFGVVELETAGRWVPSERAWRHGRAVSTFRGANGVIYDVFSDWSVAKREA